MPRSPQDIYARHLLSQRGYPLWTPEPSSEFLAYRRDGLRIGDVGVIIPEDGYFDVFFNLCLPHDHPFHHAKGVPDNFRPIKLDDTDFRTAVNAENPRCIIATSSVKTVRIGKPSGGSPSTRSGTQSTGLEYEFSLSSSEGALLILPEGAERCDLRNSRPFLEAAIRHGVDWYRFVEEKIGQIIGNDSLYLITGLYKTHSWSLAAFEKTTGGVEYPAQLWLPQLGGGDPMATCTWDTTRTFDRHAGPVDNYGLPNQTVFIRGFKIRQRTRIFWPRRITVKADAPSTQRNPAKSVGAIPRDSRPAYISGDLSTGRTAESSGSGARDEVAVDPTSDVARNEIQNDGALAVGENVVIHRIPEASQAFHPSDIINSYLLDKEPSANIAVTHDDEWITLLEKNLLRPEDLAQAGLLETLMSQNYDIFSEADAVYLRSRPFPSIQHQNEIDVIFVGHTGVGKSTLINMIRGVKDGSPTAAKTSNGAPPCTEGTTSYLAQLETGLHCQLWDTRGLDESVHNHDRGPFARIIDRIRQRTFQQERELKAALRNITTDRTAKPVLMWCILASNIDMPVHWEQFRMVYVEYCNKNAIPVVVLTRMGPNVTEWEQRSRNQLERLDLGGTDSTDVHLLRVGEHRNLSTDAYKRDCEALRNFISCL